MIKQTISSVVIKLKELEVITEDKFLKYGGLLNKNHNNIQKILENTQNTISIISAQNLSANISSLEKIIDELCDSINISKDKLTNTQDSIAKINENIELINERVGDFGTFIKRLRMLGLSTKIESARIGQTSNGFQNLAVNVESLSNKIEVKTKAISSKSQGLFRLITEVSNKASLLQDKNDNLDLHSFREIKESISLFSEKIIKAKDNSENISIYSSEISKIISSLISSFQYQDISKQQIEHICSALKGIEKTDSPSSNDSSEWASTAYNVFSIQYAQIQNTRNEFLKASKEMIEKLKEINESMGNFQRINVELLNINDGTQESCISLIEKGIQDISNILSKNTEGVNEIINLVNQVNDTVNLLASFVKEIEDIDEDIELISMNAQIKAARLGDEGAALGVLAQNIQQLSAVTKLETSTITSSFNLVNEQSGLLNQLLVSSSENLKHLSNESIKKDLNNIFMMLEKVQNDLMSNMDHTDYLIKELHNNFNETEDLSAFYNNAETIFNEVTVELNQVIKELSGGKGFNSKSNELISKLKENYTMQSERNIHDSIYNNNDNEANPETNDNSESSNDFGDNVDLF